MAIVGLGGLLGVLFSVPLRRSLIIEEKLKFPEGVAAAEVLKVGANPGAGAKSSGLASVVAGLFKLVTSGFGLLPETFVAKSFVGERGIAFFSFSFSPVLLGVGYIVGLNVAVLIAAGGLFSWWVAIPVYNSFFFNQDPVLLHKLVGLDPEDAAFAIWRAQVRYIGVGCMLTGAFWALWSLRKSLLKAVRSGLKASARGAAKNLHTERDLPMGAVLLGIALIRDTAVCSVLPGGGQPRRGAGDGRDHDHRGLFVFLGERLHGRPRRLIEQSRVSASRSAPFCLPRWCSC